MDCIEEEEEYLRNERNYYDDCNIQNFTRDDPILNAATDNECLENRCRLILTRDDEPFIGHEPDDDCTCDAQKQRKPQYKPNHYTREYNIRGRRQTQQPDSASGTARHVRMSANGERVLVQDQHHITKTRSLSRSTPIGVYRGRMQDVSGFGK